MTCFYRVGSIFINSCTINGQRILYLISISLAIWQSNIKRRSWLQANVLKYVECSGYISPEYAMEGKFSEKSDVFSFGVLILEIVCGRRNSSFIDDEWSMNLVGHVRWHCLLQFTIVMYSNFRHDHAHSFHHPWLAPISGMDPVDERQCLGADRRTDGLHVLFRRSMQVHSSGPPVRARVTSREAEHVAGAQDAEWWCCTACSEASRVLCWKSTSGWQGYRIREPPHLHWAGRQVEYPWLNSQKFQLMDYQGWCVIVSLLGSPLT